MSQVLKVINGDVFAERKDHNNNVGWVKLLDGDEIPEYGIFRDGEFLRQNGKEWEYDMLCREGYIVISRNDIYRPCPSEAESDIWRALCKMHGISVKALTQFHTIHEKFSWYAKGGRVISDIHKGYTDQHGMTRYGHLNFTGARHTTLYAYGQPSKGSTWCISGPRTFAIEVLQRAKGDAVTNLFIWPGAEPTEVEEMLFENGLVNQPIWENDYLNEMSVNMCDTVHV